ncbi:MAG: polysaccharide deacetylase family protein [Bacillota bacterium]
MMKKYYTLIITFSLIIGIIVGISFREISLPTIVESNGAIYQGSKGMNQLSIAMNVDWGEEYIDDILHCLNKNDIKITFFVTGQWSKKNPQLLKKIVKNGHEIGNHGYSHKHLYNLSNQELINLIKDNEELIYNLSNYKTTLFAPPYGEVNKRITTTAKSIGYHTIMWSADTIDWQKPSVKIIAQRAINKSGDGAIILMHPTENSLKALDQIIKKLKERGYKFVTISKLIKEVKLDENKN